MKKLYSGWTLSKILNCGRNKLYEALRSAGYLNSDNTPGEEHRDIIKSVTKHTAKGNFNIPLFTADAIKEFETLLNYRSYADRYYYHEQ